MVGQALCKQSAGTSQRELETKSRSKVLRKKRRSSVQGVRISSPSDPKNSYCEALQKVLKVLEAGRRRLRL